jgi:formylglycine-generating enzyme required for sulfatase activity
VTECDTSCVVPRPRLLLAFVLTAAVGCTIYNSGLLVPGDGGGGEAGDGPPAGSCESGTSECVDKTVSHCVGGSWVVEEVCPKGCADGGGCVENPSCQGGGPGADQTCGPSSTTDCCAALPVPGGTYERSGIPEAGATVSSFVLDEFEVTVGRYRKFVNAGFGTKLMPPAEGSGASPYAPGSGWSSAWNDALPSGTNSLETSFMCALEPNWTSSIGDNDGLPMNCLTWYEAFAFCVWDGGRLPSEAEWNFAAAAGAENRYYPWSNPPSSEVITPQYAAYQCTAHDHSLPPSYGDAEADGAMGPLLCEPSDLVPVGSLPMGNGKWGHADLAGNVAEWTLDWYVDPYPVPCKNCESLDAGKPACGPMRVYRGGGYYYETNYLTSWWRLADLPSNRDDSYGVRCARD